MIWRVILLLSLVIPPGMKSVADTSAPTNSMSRYQVIIDKSPFKRFSDPNPGVAPTTQGGPLSLAGIFGNEGKEKKAWLRDSQNKYYCVGEGESVNEYRVEKIDVQKQVVVLNHGVETMSLAFPEKHPGASAPAALTDSRPAYRGPRASVTPSLQAPVAPPANLAPMPMPSVMTPAQSHTNEHHAAAPTSLRRRILRQAAKPVQPPPETPEQKEAKAAKEETQAGEAAVEAAPAAE